ncbi:FAD-binding oxidoreductase [Pseudoduganella sp. OTU4001]|uniref:FAD-binding oxidoreductase n=1 Tax=Pseudoduganella sp. OTU4001 TaxID=3043854 RepID=UPI00313A7C47
MRPALQAETSNLTGVARAAGCVLYPRSTRQVRNIVRRANRRGLTIYVVSTGLNYGYGGRSPPRDTDILLDLSRMRRILNAGAISAANPVALIEPGVTQQDLYEHLQQHAPELTFNVTGSARATSILGNALDRGVGYFGARKEDVFGLEVVTGKGDVIYTGFRRLGEASPLAHTHPYGLGPMLDGLFFQSNLGIVTSACFRLLPRRPKAVAVSLALREAGRLDEFIDVLAALKREGIMDSVTHIANRARSQASLEYGIHTYLQQECGLAPDAAARESGRALAMATQGEWTSLGALTGSGAGLRAALAEVRQRIGHLARVRVITHQRLDLAYRVLHALRMLPPARALAAAIAAIRPLHVLALGQPTDAAVDNLLWKFGASGRAASELDQTNCGLLFINPALPMDGATVARVMRRMERWAKRKGLPLYITINIESATSLVAVINVLFDRSAPQQVQQAHDLSGILHRVLHKEKLEVYRARADMMAQVTSAADPFWQAVRELKHSLDPGRVLAPGRYNLD